jgi:hypothetical protein
MGSEALFKSIALSSKKRDMTFKATCRPSGHHHDATARTGKISISRIIPRFVHLLKVTRLIHIFLTSLAAQRQESGTIGGRAGIEIERGDGGTVRCVVIQSQCWHN